MWRRNFFVWEEDLLNNLLEDLEGHVGSHEEDEWLWKLEEDGRFSVKSMYTKLEGMFILDNKWGTEEKAVFRQVWKSPAPSKAVALSWKLLLDRIPTRVNLSTRHALPREVSLRCALCDEALETSNHLFMHCRVARGVWLELFRWIDTSFIMPPSLFIHWFCWNVGASNKKVTNGFRLIWHAAIWMLWKARNDKIFKDTVCEVPNLVEGIKVLSWRWSLTRLKIPACLFYEWCWNPKDCLKR